MADHYNPPRIEDNANYLLRWMRDTTRNVITVLNGSLQAELQFDVNLFVEPIAGLLVRSYTVAEQPIHIARQISELVKGIARDSQRDPQIANYVATVLATLAGNVVETLEFKTLALMDIDAVVNPVPGLDLPRTPVAEVAQQPGFNREAYEEQLDRDIGDLRQFIFTDLTSKFTIIREVHMDMLIESLGRRIIPNYEGNPVIRQFIAEDLMPLLIRIIGHVFSTEGPFIIENLRRIYVLSTAQPFDRNAAQKAGVIKFTGGPRELQQLSADNLDDLKQYNEYPLEAINAYAYWKLLLYAPAKAWQEVAWMKNLISSVSPQWWENPAKRFDFFINAWILDMLSRVHELKADTIKQKIVRWKQLVALPAGVRNKITISRPLLAEIGLFDAFFKIDYQMIFAEPDERVDINPFRFLLDDEIGDEFITDHFLQGIMIDCAKQALCVYVREAAIVRANRLRTYNGELIAGGIVSNKRVDLRGLRYFLDFVDEKFLSPPESLERSSMQYFALTEVMGTFMNYVSIYAFHNGFPPEGGVFQWTAGRSPTLTGRGRVRGREYQALLTYLDELRVRVVNNQPLCNTTPNVYLDIPVEKHEPAPAPPAPPARPTAPSAPTPARPTATSTPTPTPTPAGSVGSTSVGTVVSAPSTAPAHAVTPVARAVTPAAPTATPVALAARPARAATPPARVAVARGLAATPVVPEPGPFSKLISGETQPLLASRSTPQPQPLRSALRPSKALSVASDPAS